MNFKEHEKSVQETYSKEEIIISFQRVFNASVVLFEKIPAEKFFVKPESGWSVSENIKHLTKSIIPVTFGLNVPVIFAKIIFGKSSIPRKYTEIRNYYVSKLNNGRKAGVLFTPSYSLPQDKEATRLTLLNEWKQAGNKFIIAIQKHDENVLDDARMPHPIIGIISYREMLFFSIYHICRHLSNVEGRVNELK